MVSLRIIAVAASSQSSTISGANSSGTVAPVFSGAPVDLMTKYGPAMVSNFSRRREGRCSRFESTLPAAHLRPDPVLRHQVSGTKHYFPNIPPITEGIFVFGLATPNQFYFFLFNQRDAPLGFWPPIK